MSLLSAAKKRDAWTFTLAFFVHAKIGAAIFSAELHQFRSHLLVVISPLHPPPSFPPTHSLSFPDFFFILMGFSCISSTFLVFLKERGGGGFSENCSLQMGMSLIFFFQGEWENCWLLHLLPIFSSQLMMMHAKIFFGRSGGRRSGWFFFCKFGWQRQFS